MEGLSGAVLDVDLTTGRIERGVVQEPVWRRFLGGAGVAARWFWENADPAVFALSPDNPCLLFTGALAGTGIPGSSRFAVCAKSPLTGIWGESTCGGTFAPELRAAGLDGLIIRGASARPVVLAIDGNRAELLSGEASWGLDTYEACDALRGLLGGERPARVCTIGPAGERLVRFAAICHDKHDFAGRCGLGAVWGSKKLKGIVCRGDGSRVPPVDPAALGEVRRRLVRQARESVPAQSMREMGTDATMDLSMMIGDVPIRNYTRGEALDIAAGTGGPTMTERFLVRSAACNACPIACRRVMKHDGEPFRTAEGPGPEYETCAAFGPLCENADGASLLALNEWCNRYGMDTISAGSTVAFAIDCAEQGLLTAEQLDGLELRWGNAEAMLELVHRIGRRQGLGDLLAEGSREAARRIGRGAERLTAEIKGLELPMHDPRGSHGLGLAYMMSNRGACHNAHLMHPVEQGMVVWKELGFAENYVGPTSEGKAEAVVLAENYGVPCNAVPLCVFDNWTYQAGDPVAALNAATGWGLTIEDYLRAGARIWLQKRALNNLMGVGRADDRLPLKVLTPLEDGAVAGSVPDEALLRDEYYRLRGLDERGWPTRSALEAADLPDVADRLEKVRAK